MTKYHYRAEQVAVRLYYVDLISSAQLARFRKQLRDEANLQLQALTLKLIQLKAKVNKDKI